MKLGLITILFYLPVLFYAQSSNTAGNATSIGDECYLVTPSQNWQNGAVWFLDPLNLTEEFTIDLNINLGIYDSNGADGMVFVMQTVGTNLLGDPGGGLGYEGINPSLGVELDTWQNTDMGDPFEDHISIISDGNVNHSASTNVFGPVPASTSNSNIEDGAFHKFRLDWFPDINKLDVYFDCDLRISVEVDVINDIFDGVTQVYWGFTASTGGSNNNQSVCLDAFTLGLPETETICNGESIQLGVNGGEGSSYLWTPNEGINDPSEQYPIFNPSESTYYTVEYTDYCGETQFQNVNIDVTDFSIDIVSEIDLCDNEAFLFEPDVPEGSVLLWNNDIESPTFTVSEAGIVEVYGEYLGCTDESTSMVTEIDFSVDIASEIVLCNNEAFLFEPDVPEGSVLLWNNDIESPTFTVSEAGIVEVYGEYLGCSDVSTSMVTEIDFSIDIASEIGLCNNETFLFEPDVPEGSVLLWNNDIESPAFTVSEAGIVEVYGEYSGCSDVSTSLVTVHPFPFPLDAPNDVIETCENEVVEINAYCEGCIYDWGGYDEPVYYSENEAGVHIVEITNEFGCTSFFNYTILVTSSPQIVLDSLYQFCQGTDGVLSSGLNATNMNVIWNTNDTTPMIIVAETGEYSVYASNQCGSDEASTIVSFDACSCDIWAPTAFTPDNDGVNDVFVPVISCDAESYQLNIFNRWGEVVFSSSNQAEIWTGSVQNGDYFMRDGVYAWEVSYSSQSDQLILHQERGHVTLIR